MANLKIEGGQELTLSNKGEVENAELYPEMQRFDVGGTSNYHFVTDMIKRSITVQKAANTNSCSVKLGELLLQFGTANGTTYFPKKYKQLLALTTAAYGHDNWGNHVPTSWVQWANGSGFRLRQACGDDDGAHLTAGNGWGGSGWYIAIGIPEDETETTTS